MLEEATGRGEAMADPNLSFYAAVARQCFINEYIYALGDGEDERVRNLQARLMQALKDGDPVPALWPIAVGAYVPLHTIAGAEALLARAWPECVETLLVQQIKEPKQEQEIAATIPVLTAIEDPVSREVQRQYEENPYPRWIKAGPPFQPAILRDDPAQQPAPDVLIAGCGTGLSAAEFARHMRNARILAVDLSLASLSYAKRMAQSLGLGQYRIRPGRHYEIRTPSAGPSTSSIPPACCIISPIRGPAGRFCCRCCGQAASCRSACTANSLAAVSLLRAP